MLNTFLICLSLKYLRKNYIFISNISKWINFELIKVNYKETKFIRSLDKKDFEVIKVLIKFNENIELLSKYLIKYCWFFGNHLDIIKLLIDNGADVHAQDDYALRYASCNIHFEVVKILIDNGANVHAKKDEALRYASKYGHFDIVKLLIDNGADIHAEDDEALRFASCNGHLEIVKLLINNGVNINGVNINEALRLARWHNRLNVVNFLKFLS